MYQIPQDFKDYIKDDCDRKSFICSYLKKHGVETAIISQEGKNHIYVKFPVSQYNPMLKIKTVICHYDRVEGSPGANDNSAANFCLMETAIALASSKSVHNMRIIFTDGEELGDSGVKDQGAYHLALLFKRLNLLNDDIFVFDSMGRGDVPVICETDFPSSVPFDFKNKYNQLERKAQDLLINSNNGKWFKLKTSYSDNAGFIVNGIPAVAITMLPSDEITDCLHGDMIETWTRFHTPADNFESLWPKSFEITKNILNNLAKARFIIE